MGAEFVGDTMKLSRLIAGCFGIAALCGIALAQTGSGPAGRPPTGGNLPQDFDTLSQAITAGTTQTQAGATLCTSTICYIGTVGTTNDGIKIRQCTLPPMRVTVVNLGANAAKVYGSGTDTINGVATATGVTLAAVTTTPGVGVAEYICVVGGTAAQWVSLAH
jgi:hypothetical protein